MLFGLIEEFFLENFLIGKFSYQSWMNKFVVSFFRYVTYHTCLSTSVNVHFLWVEHVAARSEDKCYQHVYREQMDIPPSLSQLSTSWRVISCRV